MAKPVSEDWGCACSGVVDMLGAIGATSSARCPRAESWQHYRTPIRSLFHTRARFTDDTG